MENRGVQRWDFYRYGASDNPFLRYGGEEWDCVKAEIMKCPIVAGSASRQTANSSFERVITFY